MSCLDESRDLPLFENGGDMERTSEGLPRGGMQGAALNLSLNYNLVITTITNNATFTLFPIG